MDEMQQPTSDPAGSTDAAGMGSPANGGSTDGSNNEGMGWTGADTGTGNDPRAAAERMLGQLQSMIDTIAVQAAPVVRQIGAKAAELAAVAADRAGPLAQRAADATADASVRIAERSRTLAAELRLKTEGGSGEADTSGSVPLEGVDDAAERSAKDDPAEGPQL
jgi:hypothetical protein